MAESKKTITVKLKVPDLVYDVQNKTHLTGKARESEGTKNFEAAANMKASDDEDADYQVRRSLTTAYATVKSELGEFLNENDTESTNLLNKEIDPKIEENGELTLSFLMPSNFSNSSVGALGANIHSYMVNLALLDWFTITNKQDAADYAAKATADLESVKRAIYKRSRPERPTYDDTTDTATA